MLWFSCRCGSCFLFSFPVFPVLNLEIQKFGPTKTGSFGVSFSECHHRHFSNLWLGSGRNFDETKSLSFANRDAMAGCNMFFSWKPIQTIQTVSVWIFCMFFFNQKLDKQKSNVEFISQSKIHGFCWNSRKFVACHSCSCHDFCSHEKISGKLLLLEPFSLVVSSQCQLPPSKKYSKVVLRRLLTTFITWYCPVRAWIVGGGWQYIPVAWNWKCWWVFI